MSVEVYKLLSKELWQQSSQEQFVPKGPQDKDFIHLCEKHQIERIVAKYFSEAVVALKLDRKKLPGRLVKEQNRPGGDEYYHLYDSMIPVNCIKAIEEL